MFEEPKAPKRTGTPDAGEPAPRTALDHLFFGLSSAADHSLLWLALGSLRAARVGDPAAAVRLAAALGAESALTNGLIKSVFRRIRPAPHPELRPENDAARLREGPLPYGLHKPITSSFPSGHATAAFTAATLLGDGTRLGVAYFGLAALVAASRVYVGLHHPSDVVVGAALGLAFGAVARRVVPLTPGR
ncbi:MAG: phosphatase PAP2 family protein [Acidimicrobiia bacterium]